jgi:uncharacterized repeat protein (TIGR01451 family)
VPLPANGNTWRIEADQEARFPGRSIPQLSVEGCSKTGVFSPGFLGQFPVNDADPTLDVECTVNTGPYDPNDKQGFPLGYGQQHYIRAGTDLEYLIRFQNVGTDTAFNVVVLDTLPPGLDITTVRPGAGSAPYQFEAKSSNILVFSFLNIKLPDSTTNNEASNGFVKFRISPRPDAPAETDIKNKAAIYFDYNDPVITDATRHRIGGNFVSVGLWEPRMPAYSISVSPNPMRDRAVLSLVGAPDHGVYRLRLFDLQGKVQLELLSNAPQFELKKEALPPGTYLFGVELGGQAVGAGKLVKME